MNTDTPKWLTNIFLKTWRPFFWIALIVFIIYFSTLSFDLTLLDDHVLVKDNYYFLKDLKNIPQAFQGDVFSPQTKGGFYYRPIMTLSLMLDAHLGGQSLIIYHLSNIIAHLLTAYLLFLLLTKLKYQKALSFILSLFFAGHPAVVQAVAWIPGRNDILLSLLILLSFILFLSFVNNKNRVASSWHLLVYFLALLTKETALILPIICLLYLIVIKKEKRLSAQSGFLLIGWSVLTIIWYFSRQAALQNLYGYTPPEVIKSVFLNIFAVFLFIGKTILPFNLSTYPILSDSTIIYGLIVTILVSILLILSKYKRWAYVIWGSAWFLLFLLPSFVRPDASIVPEFLEHRMYLPLIGFIIILAEIDWIKKLFDNKKTLFAAVSIILALSIATVVHSQNYKNSYNYWTQAIKTSPHSAFAYKQMGVVYYFKNQYNEAEDKYKQALKLNPDENLVHNNLGLIYAKQGKLELAEKEYKKELSINPAYDNAHFNLGLLYSKTDRINEAVNLWKKTLELNPNYFDAANNLAFYYFQQGDIERAKFYINHLKQRGGQARPELLQALENK
ncbi:tetratricopeptide repeat protein [Patescibacteria group bacterium]|nr:tetratricopeptide repeat protein [Patescibacteria group bacterium]